MGTAIAVVMLGMPQGEQAVEKKVPSLEEMIRMRVVWSEPGMSEVVVRRDLVYKTGDAGPLHMDVHDARKAPPILVARAGLDNPWLNDGVDRFVAGALARGATLDLLTHPDGRHGFDILDDDDRTRGIIRRTVEFLRERLAP